MGAEHSMGYLYDHFSKRPDLRSSIPVGHGEPDGVLGQIPAQDSICQTAYGQAVLAFSGST